MTDGAASAMGSAEREDAIFDRIAGGTGTPSDWQELARMADRDAQLWSRLAETLRQDCELRAALESSLGCVDGVVVPRPVDGRGIGGSRAGRSPAGHSPAGHSPAGRPRETLRHLVTAAAAGLVLVTGMILGAAGNLLLPDPAGARYAANVVSSGDPSPTVPERAAADGAVHGVRPVQLAGSEVVRELPFLLLDSRRLDGDRGVELLYVRRVVERCAVKDFYEVQRDDLGEPAVVPVSARDLVSSESF